MTLAKILQAAAGNAGAAGSALYVEDVFSTYLYTGNSSTQTITNGIDLAGEGGLVWTKERSASTYGHRITDTERGSDYWLTTNDTISQQGPLTNYTAFNTTGFTLDSSINHNNSGTTYASWTFRKAPKFFDVVTWTGNMTARTISHNLGSVPGCIIVKSTDGAGSWYVYHRSVGNTGALRLNLTNVVDTSPYWNNTDPTSTVFSLGVDSGVNASSTSYVAYLFAHNAGGFGESGTDNVISCGSFTTDGSGNATVNLGYEPQWIMYKNTGSGTNWEILDSMRGLTVDSANRKLLANTSGAEGTESETDLTATGFKFAASPSNTYIYIAIRRPMKPPESATEVFGQIARTGNGATTALTGTGVTTDMVMTRGRNHTSYPLNAFHDRLRGAKKFLLTNTYGGYSSTDAESSGSTSGTGLTSLTQFDVMDGVVIGADGVGFCNIDTILYINYFFKRAPGFFDVVCYTGNGPGTQVINHNLGVIPELLINKSRSTRGWTVFQGNGIASTMTGFLRLNETTAKQGDSFSVSSSTFTADSTIGFGMNTSAENYVTYLFATLPGISKVGSYTGNGTNQTINCGFTSGARFVLIKRTDSTGDWYVWDTARGIVSANDPHLSLNTNAAEVTTDDSVDPVSSGFIVNQVAATNVNVSSATYIYLAIA